MNKNQSLSLIAFLGVVTMMGFQNCSKVGVDDASASSKLVDNGFPADPSGMGDMPGDPSSPGGSAQLPDDGDPTDSPIKPPPDVSKDPKDPIVKRDDDCDDEGEPEGPDFADIPEAEAVALCMDAPAKVAKKIEDLVALKGPDVYKIRSSVLVVSDELNRVENIRGSAMIRGITSAAHAKNIFNIRGSVVICGMNVENIGNIRGSLLVVNSSVHTIGDIRGSVRLINSVTDSEIESIKKVRGSIELQNTDVKSIENTRGSIRAVDSEVGSVKNIRGSFSNN